MQQVWHYSQEDLIRAIRDVGIQKGDIVSIQVSLGRLGIPKEGANMQTASHMLIEAFREVMGSEGTLLVPTYTYSIGRREVYNPHTTPSSIGDFPEIFRSMPGVIRSADPMLSTAGIGAQAQEILYNISHECYGKGSTYDNIRRLGGKICTIGVSLYWATYRHYIECIGSIPFRYNKAFTGYVQRGVDIRQESWIYFAAPFTDNCAPVGLPLEKKVREADLLRTAQVGRGEIQCIDAEVYAQFGLEQFRCNPWLTAKGPALTTKELLEKEKIRVGKSEEKEKLLLTKESTALQIVQQLYGLQRDIVSYEYDEALQAITSMLPLESLQFLSGETVGDSWLVPEAWICHRAYLETVDGRKVFSTDDSPLHVQRFSQPVDTVVTQEELLKHLWVHPVLPDAIPYKALHFRREWGLCCSQIQKQQLTEENYRVVIQSDFSFSALTIGESVLAGNTKETIVFLAHLDHPAQANDGISGVAVAIKSMQCIEQYTDREYSYRLAIIPENVGPHAYIDYLKKNNISIVGGIYLNMLGRKNSFGVQDSRNPLSLVDKALLTVLNDQDKDYHTIDNLAIMDNVTRAFNAYSVGIPIVALRRGVLDEWKEYAQEGLLYPEHHSDKDTFDCISNDALDESVAVVTEMVKIIETNYVPRPLFIGEPFLTCYNIFLEDYEWIKPHEFLRVLHNINGESDLMDIALRTVISYSKVKDVINILKRVHLCE